MTDAMGSVMSVLSSTGEVLERRSYDAFGKMTCMLPDGTPVATSPTGLKVGFHGQLMDQLTGMYQMGYRWYSPVLGRWASRDPIGFEGGVNRMEFVGNYPTTMDDKFGLFCRLSEIHSASEWKIKQLKPKFETFGSASTLLFVTVKWEREFDITCLCCEWLFGGFRKKKHIKIQKVVEAKDMHMPGGGPIYAQNLNPTFSVPGTIRDVSFELLLSDLLPDLAYTAGIDKVAVKSIYFHVLKTKPSASIIPSDDDC
ncbi:MAG: RHS repeat domain-containing protein [Opitutia bacterium]